MLTRSNVAQDNLLSLLLPIAPAKNCIASITARTATTPTRAVSSAQKSCCQLMFQKSMQTEKHYGTPLRKWRKERKHSLPTASIFHSRMNLLRKKTSPLQDNSLPSILSAVAWWWTWQFMSQIVRKVASQIHILSHPSHRAKRQMGIKAETRICA